MSHFDLHLSQGMRNRETLFKKKTEKDDSLKQQQASFEFFIGVSFLLYALPTFDFKYFYFYMYIGYLQIHVFHCR